MNQTKAELRKKLLKQRQSLSTEEWKKKSDRICYHLQSSSLFSQAKTILAYFSFRYEPDLSSLFPDTKHFWGFPRCVGKSLVWHSWQPGETIERGNYGIFEPHRDAPTLEAKDVDLILVPAVACDVWGYRLGYGGGFYDRLLSSPDWLSKPTIGIVFDFAYLPELPREDWDLSLQAICTESGIGNRKWGMSNRENSFEF